MNNLSPRILVTGANGFLGKHIVLLLLENGFRVRGTLRSSARIDSLLATLKRYTAQIDHLELVITDLWQDDGWQQAVEGCNYVLHVASPFPANAPIDEDDLIIPAREGTLRVLNAAYHAGVQRVVLTSSTAAVSAGYSERVRTFSEVDWSNLEGNVSPYQKSKTLAEKAAWDYVGALPEDQALELVVINPGYILGPVLDNSPATSNELLVRLMKHRVPGNARITFNVVDVRDVAQAHFAAMRIPEASGRRFICVADSLWMREFSDILRAHYSKRGYKIPAWNLPNSIIRLGAVFDKTARNNLHSLEREYSYDSTPTRTMLDWRPRPMEETVIEMAESLISVGIV